MLNKMQEIVLSYPKLKERIDKSKDSIKLKEKALKNLEELRANYSATTFKVVEKMLDAALPRLYDGINFYDNDYKLGELMKTSSLVLVPNHQSHADYIAINYKFNKEYKTPLHVAGGDNLNIFPIGNIFRKCGCFFIRRSFQSDILYKLTLEAYLFYLLLEKKPIEFFFEGGRTRSGKLRPPKYGLYQMILEAHSHLPVDKDGKRSDLLFVPVSIAHEYVPEQAALANEMMGGKKVKESSSQLLGLIKLVSYQFGNVHINVGEPVKGEKKEDQDENKKNLQDLAFKCFRRVGNQMLVTPTSLLVLILLDETTGALNWHDILAKANIIIEFCFKFDIPFTKGLDVTSIEKTLGRTLDILISNKKIEVIGKNENSTIFYTIKKECRGELLFFKNTIVHHFIIPWTINLMWINLFTGKITSVEEFKNFFLDQRNQLKHEFYLPTTKEFITKTIKVLSDATGKEITTFKDCIDLTQQELYSIAEKLGIFARSLSYINEAYYIVAMAMRSFGDNNFNNTALNKKIDEVFEHEIKIAGVIRFPESRNVELSKNALRFFLHEQFVERKTDGDFHVSDEEALNKFRKKLESELKAQLKFNLRVL